MPITRLKKAYQKALEKHCPEFGYMRNLANVVKHAEATQNPSTQMGSLSATRLARAGSRAPSSAMPSRPAPTSFPRQRRMSLLILKRAADAVMKMWNHLFSSEVGSRAGER